MQEVPVAEAGRLVPALVPQEQHVGQVSDVARGQAQRLDLGEPPVRRLGGDERAERRERRVHAVRPVSLPRVGRLPLLVDAGETRVSAASSARFGAASPLSPPPRRRHRPFGFCAGAANSGAVAVHGVGVGGEVVGLPACRPHPGPDPLCSAGARPLLHITLCCG